MASIKRNFIWNLILTMASYVFPLITFPYVTRVLGADGLGICEFVDNVINYYILFSMMGLNIIGVREIANQKGDQIKLSQAFISLLLINGFTTFIAIVALIISIYTVPEFSEHEELMWMGVCKVAFNFLLIEWFYKGIEEFKYITVRSLIIKCLYVVGVLMFVRNHNDYNIYYLMTLLMVGINSLVNIVHVRKSLLLDFRNISIRKYLKPYFLLGAYAVLTSLYTTFNVVFLGFMSGTTQVGYFSVASKIHILVLSVFTAFTTVMLPRMSSLVSQNDNNGFDIMIGKSLNMLLMFAIPSILILECFTSNVVHLIAGSGFENSVIMLRILAPLIFIMGFEQILVMQILMPFKKDNSIFLFSALGAVIGITMNIITVKSLQGVGSACSWLTTEIIIMICAILCVNREKTIKYPLSRLFVLILAAIPLSLVLFSISNLLDSEFLSLLTGTFITITYYGLIYAHMFKVDMASWKTALKLR